APPSNSSPHRRSYISPDLRPLPTAAPPPPHTPPSNPADQSPPAQYDPTSSIPDSANPCPHHPTGKFHPHTPRCAANCSRPFPPTTAGSFGSSVTHPIEYDASLSNTGVHVVPSF